MGRTGPQKWVPIYEVVSARDATSCHHYSLKKYSLAAGERSQWMNVEAIEDVEGQAVVRRKSDLPGAEYRLNIA